MPIIESRPFHILLNYILHLIFVNLSSLEFFVVLHVLGV